MRRHQVPGGDFTISTSLPRGQERLLFRGGLREDDAKGTRTAFAITYSYLPGGGMIEHESMEIYAKNDDLETTLKSRKYVVREHPPSITSASLALPKSSRWVHGNTWVTVETLGYTLEGGEGIDPREPHARFVIDDPYMLRLTFGDLGRAGRQPNATGSYVVLEGTEMDPLITPTVIEVNDRKIIVTEVGEITLDFAPDTPDGQVGRLLKAYFRKVKWVEGDIINKQGAL